ncbi:DUF7130 family rubredoxin-like protein [Halorussus sp. AFM4]|uniref:DUF7130 family rubredoxin-like protein n=1 Tax=Halorussus sp. AFM4 TaxID=3421651 RepID=UPI003EBA2F90
MVPESDRPPVEGNKEETEVPIGDAPDTLGQSYTMWRCVECGEMGKLEDEETLPESCPECSVSKEALLYWEED